MTAVGPGDLVLNKTCLSGLSLWSWRSQGEITIALQKSRFCWYVVFVKCTSLIRANWFFLPNCKLGGKGLLWVSDGSHPWPDLQHQSPKFRPADPLYSFALSSHSTSLPQRPDWLLGPSSICGRSCLWAFGQVSPLFKTLPPPPPFLQILPKLWGPTQLYFLSSELTRHFYPHHAMKDRTAVQLAGEVDSGAVLPVWPWLGAFLSLHFFIYKNGNNNCI